MMSRKTRTFLALTAVAAVIGYRVWKPDADASRAAPESEPAVHVAAPVKRVRLDVRGSRIIEVADSAGAVEAPAVALEPELLTGVGATGQERRRPRHCQGGRTALSAEGVHRLPRRSRRRGRTGARAAIEKGP